LIQQRPVAELHCKLYNYQLSTINCQLSTVNYSFCLNQGTSLGWLIDPQAKLVITFQPQQQPEVKQGSHILPVLPTMASWQLSVNQLFQWLSFNLPH